MIINIAAAAAGLIILLGTLLWRYQVLMMERRRYMTALWLELASHEETLSICERANYAIPLTVQDWPWIRYFLAGSTDPQLLAELAAYYSAVDSAWNVWIRGNGQTQDNHQQKILRSLMEANARIYKRLEEEVKILYQPRYAWKSWLRNVASAQARLRQRVAQVQFVNRSKV